MKNKGFTFIEMLVVVVIIGVLASVGVANFKVANQKARDGRRQGDLQQIRAALELYRTDVNLYPTSTFPAVGGDLTYGGTTYMSNRPGDPLDPTYTYYYSSNGARYTLCAYLEIGGIAGSCSTNSCTGAACNYIITNPL
ncbi:MAG: prepilin-type N-terminal cleavage/methylation domain-containing protein [Patescibacteria group bacterium]|nr:prepilin-type N-terminal cleavage/methylation domain-containing protein [Patescibacteria group bacterium]